MILDRPPAGWKRPSLSIAARCDVLIRQGGLDAVTGAPLGDYANVRFDHRPALWERQFDTETNDTIPPANDPAHIDALSIKSHDIRTHGPGGERRIHTAGSDSGRRSKEVRISKKQAEFRRRLLKNTPLMDAELVAPVTAKRKQKIPSRPMQSRGFEKRKRP